MRRDGGADRYPDSGDGRKRISGSEFVDRDSRTKGTGEVPRVPVPLLPAAAAPLFSFFLLSSPRPTRDEDDDDDDGGDGAGDDSVSDGERGKRMHWKALRRRGRRRNDRTDGAKIRLRLDAIQTLDFGAGKEKSCSSSHL